METGNILLFHLVLFVGAETIGLDLFKSPSRHLQSDFTIGLSTNILTLILDATWIRDRQTTNSIT